MGVVRREGDWRLEKREDGVYEVSYDREPRVRVVTAEREEQVLDADTLGQVTVRQVTDYDDVTAAFEEYVARDDPATVGPLGRTRVDPGGDAEGDGGDDDADGGLGPDDETADAPGAGSGDADDGEGRESAPRRGDATRSGRPRRAPAADEEDDEDDAPEEAAGRAATGARVAGGLAGTALAFGGGLLAGTFGVASTTGLTGVGLAALGALPAAWAATR